MKKLVVLSGAGISAESGFSTFRDAGGLWETYPVEQVATPEGWAADAALVTDFYNRLRRQLVAAEPNAGHHGLAALEHDFDVTVVTQNVDDLHERAGSQRVIHLHGELMKVCSELAPADARFRRTLPREAPEADLRRRCADGGRERPFIVWFGESVPLLEAAAEAVAQADVFVIIGTSLNVYPAAGLVRVAPPEARVLLIDPNPPAVPGGRAVEVIRAGASEGVAELRRRLLGGGA